MDSPFWHGVGVFGAIGFPLAIVMSLVARSMFTSSDSRKVKLGGKILSALGGVSVAREVESELQRRKIA